MWILQSMQRLSVLYVVSLYTKRDFLVGWFSKTFSSYSYKLSLQRCGKKKSMKVAEVDVSIYLNQKKR